MKPSEMYIGKPVRSLQTMLRCLGTLEPEIPAVVPDGIYGDQTEAAVAAFQRCHALDVTGVADHATWNTLVNAYTAALPLMSPPEPLRITLQPGQRIRPGECNSHLFLIQAMLLALRQGCASIPALQVTGCHDEPSVQAVRWLQEKAGLEQSGDVDAVTWLYLVKLYSALSRDGTCGCALASGGEI